MSRYTLIKYISRLMAVLLVLTVVLSAAPVARAAESGSCGENLTWSLEDGTLTITGSGAMTDFPESAMAPWYPLRHQILRVNLPDGLTAIGSLAFYECAELTTVVIPGSVRRIGSYAFANCTGLQLLNLGGGVESIGEAAFSDCYAIASLTLPGSLKTIGAKAFYRCESITILTVPASVTSIGMEAFGYCKSLVSADVQAQIATIPEFLFYGCSLLSSVKLPDTASGINEFAFRGCDNLSTVYYDGENKTPEEIQEIITEDVPSFGGTGNVTGGTSGSQTASGSATENPDGTVTQQNTTVDQGDDSTVTTTVTNTHPEDSLSGDISAEIVVNVEGEEGWDDAAEAVTDALKDVNSTVTNTGSSTEPPQITVYVQNTDSIDPDFIDSLAGRDVNVTIVTQDGSVWQFNTASMEGGSGAYDLRYEIKAGSPELCEELGTDRCFVLTFLAPAQINAEVMIRLAPGLSLQNATLMQRDEELNRIQTTVVDYDGYAHFYLGAVSDEVEYYIAVNLPQEQQEAIVPEVIQQAYGSPQFIEPIKYEITGRKSSWNMTFGQVTWIMAAVLVGCVVVVGFVMFALNKRKLSMGYVPDLDEEDYE